MLYTLSDRFPDAHHGRFVARTTRSASLTSPFTDDDALIQQHDGCTAIDWD
jgi:hypothetical protein